MNILADLTSYIETNSSVDISDIDSFYTDSSTSVMLQQVPSESVETRYMDGSRTGVFSFDIYVKNTNAFTCITSLTELETLLDLPNGLILDDFEVLKCIIASSATLVQKTDKNEKIYSSSFKLDYYNEK